MPTKVHASGFAAVPYGLMDQAPDSFVVHVYAVLHRHGWASKQGAWMSIETIRRQTGISARSIRRSLGWLKDAGWVTATPRSGDTTVYHVRIDAPAPRKRATPLQKSQGSNPLQNRQDPLAKSSGDPLQNRQPNKNPRTRTQVTPLPSKDFSNNGRGVQGGETGSKPKPKPKPDPLRLKRLPDDAIPLGLLDCANLLIEFWAVKKGTRSTLVFNRVTKKLLSWSASERQEALERAIAAGWGDVFQPQPRAGSRPPWAPPEVRHPASRVFTADRGFIDEPTTGGVLNGLI